MKKILLSLIALAVGLTAAAATATHVRVNPHTGSPLLVSFQDEPEIVFLTDGVKVTAKGADPVTFVFEDINSIDFTSTNEVETPGSDALRMAAYPDRVEFLNVPEGADVKVYSLSGRLEASLAGNGTVTLYKADFDKGIHIVAIGNNSFKLTF